MTYVTIIVFWGWEEGGYHRTPGSKLSFPVWVVIQS